MAGPIAIFDKSFLQSLNVDESVWFDNFFMTNITPIFFIEIVADLEKEMNNGRTPEQVVGNMAYKTPEMNSYPNDYHVRICHANLMGHDITMDRRPIINRGYHVQSGDSIGYVVKETPEQKALNNWQNGNFIEVEKEYARSWRHSIASMDLNIATNIIKTIGIEPKNCKDPTTARRMAESILEKINKSTELMEFALIILGIHKSYHKRIINKWERANKPLISIYAPYAAYVLRVQLFFYIAIASNIISKEKVTNAIDLMYLFYLPFCMIFISNDKFHEKYAPIFLSNDQEFVWGNDLKRDLSVINEYFNNYPLIVKEMGLYKFASYPPTDGQYIVTRIWDRYVPGWREWAKKLISPNITIDDKTKEKLNGFSKGAPINNSQINFNLPDNLDFMGYERNVHKRKGKWWQIPKDYKENE